MTAAPQSCQPEVEDVQTTPWEAGGVTKDRFVTAGTEREGIFSLGDVNIFPASGPGPVAIAAGAEIAAQIVEAVNSHAALQARVDVLTKALKWQPIETAPKNRLLLVGFFNSAGKWRSMHAQYRDDLPQHDDAADDDEPAESGWYEGSLEAEMLFPVRPTHWQPLPAAPSVPLEDRK